MYPESSGPSGWAVPIVSPSSSGARYPPTDLGPTGYPPDIRTQLQWIMDSLLAQSDIISRLTVTADKLVGVAARMHTNAEDVRREVAAMRGGPAHSVTSPVQARSVGHRPSIRPRESEAEVEQALAPRTSTDTQQAAAGLGRENFSRKDLDIHRVPPLVGSSARRCVISQTPCRSSGSIASLEMEGAQELPPMSPCDEIARNPCGVVPEKEKDPLRCDVAEDRVYLSATAPDAQSIVQRYALKDLGWDNRSALSSGIESPPPSSRATSGSPVWIDASAFERAEKRRISTGEPESSQDRRVRGRSALLPHDVLPASDGQRKGVRWPKKSVNTEKGRLQEVECDQCHGRVHWACASLRDSDSLSTEPWCCPDCMNAIANEESTIDLAVAQRERCIRPDCVMRAWKYYGKATDGDNFFVERIIGRRRVRLKSGRKVFEYLVKWEGYHLYDATWEPAGNLQDAIRLDRQFLRECESQGIGTTFRIALLPEALECWTDEGLRKRAMLLEQGVEEAMWWEDNEPDER